MALPAGHLPGAEGWVRHVRLVDNPRQPQVRVGLQPRMMATADPSQAEQVALVDDRPSGESKTPKVIDLNTLPSSI
jgi:hypothetical protein